MSHDAGSLRRGSERERTQSALCSDEVPPSANYRLGEGPRIEQTATPSSVIPRSRPRIYSHPLHGRVTLYPPFL